MARKQVLACVPADKLDVVNAYMVGLWGDDPGTQEIGLNAYMDGANPLVATHSFSNSNNSQADATSLTNFLSTQDGCGSAVYPASPPIDSWGLALSLWGLKPVVPGL